MTLKFTRHSHSSLVADRSQAERGSLVGHQRAVSSVLPEMRTQKACILDSQMTRDRSSLKWCLEMKIGRQVNRK